MIVCGEPPIDQIPFYESQDPSRYKVNPMNKTSWLVVAVACVIAVSLRLMALPWINFSAMGALAILCGAVVRPAWLGLLIPLGCRVLTDCVIESRTGYGFYGSWMFDYAAYVTIFTIGRWLRPSNMRSAFGTGLVAAAAFFVISNLGVWCMPQDGGQFLYPRTLAGLATCFVNAIPFARGTVAGDIGFSMVFFGALQLLAVTSPDKATATKTASAEV